MRLSIRVLFGLLALLFLFSPLEARRSKLPDWMKPLKAHSSKVDASSEYEARVLLDWAHYDFSREGRPRLKVRYAVRILTWDEQDRAIVSIPYNEGDEKVWHFNAWLIAPDGEIKDYDQKDAVDVASDWKNLYSESRFKILDLSDTVRPGYIFAYEYEVKEKSLLTQRIFTVQKDIPVDHVRVVVDVPEGWELKATPLNGAAGALSQNEDRYVWEAFDVEPYVEEDDGPDSSILVGRVGFSMHPKGAKQNRQELFTFDNWADVAAFGDRLNTPMASLTSEIRSKANELVAGKQSEWEKIQAIASFAQSIQYIAVSEDLNSGGGYQPFPASLVLERQYGDCKDMTALTRALLKAVGIDSYSVSANINQHVVVHEEYASPYQFDHCIVAIKVGDELEQEAVVEHPQLGRLLYFDPTMEYLPIGLMPRYIADSSILVDSDQVDALQHLPKNDGSKHYTHRDITMDVRADGSVSAQIIDITHGNSSTYSRNRYYGNTGEDFEDIWRDIMTAHTREATITSIEVEDHFEENEFIQKVSFDAPFYGRSMRGRLLVFKPVVVSRHEWKPPTEEERKTAFVKRASRFSETTRVNLPEGWVVDEMSEPISLESPFGHYEAEIHQEGRQLKQTRSIVWHAMDVAPEDYEQLVDYYEAVIKAENTPVVLVRE